MGLEVQKGEQVEEEKERRKRRGGSHYRPRGWEKAQILVVVLFCLILPMKTYDL